MRNALLRSAVVLGLATLALAAQAAPITYTFTTTGTGILNGVNFTNAALTFTAIGDTTTTVTGNDAVVRVPVTATVTVAGTGTGTFAPVLNVFSNPSLGSVGLSQVSDIIGSFGAVYQGYGLTTAFAPATGDAFGNPGTSYITTGGTFRLSQSAPNSTFSASLQAVPEPATMAALGLGAAALLRRRRKA